MTYLRRFHRHLRCTIEAPVISMRCTLGYLEEWWCQQSCVLRYVKAVGGSTRVFINTLPIRFGLSGLVYPLPPQHWRHPAMDPLHYPEPPTESSVSEARRALQVQRQELSQLSERITSEEDALAQIVVDRKRAIREMQREQHALEEKVKHTLAYISPIRRLPHELLRHIFMFNFDNHPCCAWILASVCVLWRRLALSVPKLWSKVSNRAS